MKILYYIIKYKMDFVAKLNLMLNLTDKQLLHVMLPTGVKNNRFTFENTVTINGHTMTHIDVRNFLAVNS